jgi:hypothetical protein
LPVSARAVPSAHGDVHDDAHGDDVHDDDVPYFLLFIVFGCKVTVFLLQPGCKDEEMPYHQAGNYTLLLLSCTTSSEVFYSIEKGIE